MNKKFEHRGYAVVVPAPRYADLFSRYQHNDKWHCHGDEAPPDPLDIPACLRRVAP